MADDFKKKLVQYGDKVLFGIFLVVLAATAAITLVTSKPEPETEISEPQNRPPKEKVSEEIDQVAGRLARGGVPEGYVTGGFATDESEIMPHRGEKQCDNCGYIVPEATKRCPKCGRWFESDDDNDGMPNEWEDAYNKYDSPDRYKPDADKDPDGDGFSNLKEYLGGSNPEDPKSVPSPFRITRMERKLVDVLFFGYSIKEGGSADVIDPAYWVMQINYGRNTETQFVQLGDYFRGYRLFPLERGKRRVDPGHGIPPYDEDVYVLSIQREGQEAVRLEKGKWGKTNETYVDLLVTRGKDTEKVFTDKTVGDVLVANGERYLISEVRDEKVILKGSEGEIYTLY